jgi:hypothetical protein
LPSLRSLGSVRIRRDPSAIPPCRVSQTAIHSHSGFNDGLWKRRRKQDSGLPNTQGAGPKVPNQAARAQAYTDYVTRLESLPEVIGYHWFQWSDEPKEGRFDGENSNYGLVSINDKPYAEFLAAVKAANAAAIAAHKKAVASDL